MIVEEVPEAKVAGGMDLGARACGWIVVLLLTFKLSLSLLWQFWISLFPFCPPTLYSCG